VSSLQRWLQARRPIRHWIPDLEALLVNPCGYLAEREVRIPPIPAGRILIFLYLFLAVGWAATALGREVPTKLLVATLGLGIGVPTVLFLLRPKELLFGPGGLEIRATTGTLICPWCLFARPGAVSWNDVGSFLWVPVDEARVSDVVLKRHGRVQRRGRAAVHVTRTGHARIPSNFQVLPSELGEVIQEIGRRFAAEA